MFEDNEEINALLARLRQEFIETARDQLDDIEGRIEQLEAGEGDAEEVLQGIQRDIHNIKGQGATFGFPLTGRVAHMLEDYLISAEGLHAHNLADVRAYLDLMVNLISRGEEIGEDDPQKLLNDLPTGRVATFSTQQTNTVNVLLVMPSGLQRKLVARELLSCGFRVMRAYDGVEALAVAMDIAPDFVFVNQDMTPFSGRELSNVFAGVDKLRDTKIVLLTSYEAGNKELQNLPDNISVVQKHKNFTEDIGRLLIEWGVFGDIAD